MPQPRFRPIIEDSPMRNLQTFTMQVNTTNTDDATLESMNEYFIDLLRSVTYYMQSQMYMMFPSQPTIEVKVTEFHDYRKTDPYLPPL